MGTGVRGVASYRNQQPVHWKARLLREAALCQRLEERLGTAAGSVGCPDLEVEVGCAASPGVAGPHDLVAGGHVVAHADGEAGAVAVGPAGVLAVDDREADAARDASRRVRTAAAIPPVVRPLVDADDLSCSDGVDGGVDRDDPVPRWIVVVGLRQDRDVA